MKIGELFETYQSRGSVKNLGGSNLSTFQGQNIPDFIIGNFYCTDNRLTSLEFGPKEVEGDFMCYDNLLLSLEHCPTKVGKTFDCSGNNLASLEFGPKEVGNAYHCQQNNLTSFKFIPKEINGEVNCHTNQFTSLEHCPNKINGDFNCHTNQITSLQNIHKQFKNGYISGELILEKNPLKSHVLGSILIPKLEEIFIDNNNVREILNRHLKSGRDALDCQEELIQKGFKEFAQL